MPLAEPSEIVDDVLGVLLPAQQLDRCGGGVDPKLDAPGVGVLDDLDHSIVELHVAMTSTTVTPSAAKAVSGRDSNIAHVALDQPDDVHAPPEPDDVTGRTVLYGVLRHSGAELSAHQTIAVEFDTWSSIAQLAAEYETIAVVAQRLRWTTLLRQCGLTADQVSQVVESSSFGPLASALRRADAMGNCVDTLLAQVLANRSVADAVDIGAVLHKRVRFAAGGRPRGRRDLIAGLIPAARGEMSEELRVALAERERLIESRAASLAAEAVARDEPWARRLGKTPTEPIERERWRAEVGTVAAYRDRYGIDHHSPLGTPSRSEAQRADAQVARAALRRATSIASSVATASIVDLERSLTVR